MRRPNRLQMTGYPGPLTLIKGMNEMRIAPTMSCPVCSVALVISERQSIEIDYCPQCRGVWLDRGELDKLIERSAPPVQQFEERQPAGNDFRDNRSDDKDHDHGYKKKRRKSFLEELFD